MTTVDLPDFGVYGDRGAATVSGRWSLAAGGTAELRARGRARAAWPAWPWTWKPLPSRDRATALPLVSGALVVGDPVHLTVGEVAVAVDKTRSVRLTVGEVTALGNRRFAAELIVSALGDDAGPDEIVRMEGYADRMRGRSLRIVLGGPAPASLGGANLRIRLSAVFDR